MFASRGDRHMCVAYSAQYKTHCNETCGLIQYVRIQDNQRHVIQAMHTAKQRPPLLIPID